MRHLIDRYIVSSTPANRYLLAIFASVPFFMIYGAANAVALSAPQIRAGLRPSVVWGVQAMLLASIVLMLALAAWLWPRRHARDRFEGSGQAVSMVIGLVYTTLTIGAGTLTTGATLVLLGAFAIGLLLFERRAMLITFVVCVLIINLYDLLVARLGLPYAPAITQQAFDEQGPLWWWHLWRESVFYMGTAVTFPMLLVAFSRLDDLHGQLNRLSYSDALTGLPNRRYFMERLEAEIARQRRTGQPLTLILIDADHFKAVNDQHGHAMGDEVLKRLARLMGGCVRGPIDQTARLGGEEFAILLPDTTVDQAETVCTRLQERLSRQRFGSERARFSVTVSMGVAQGMGLEAEALLQSADELLYRAKDAGRDRAQYAVIGEAAT